MQTGIQIDPTADKVQLMLNFNHLLNTSNVRLDTTSVKADVFKKTYFSKLRWSYEKV